MTVWIANAVAEAIGDEGRRLYPLETGGALLGWRDGGDVVVVGMVGPGPEALHGRTAFLPDHRWQIGRLADAFTTSGGDLDYLGDWHTHPSGAAMMSATDHATLRRISRRVHRPAMLIVAGGPERWNAAAWIWNRRGVLRHGIPVPRAVARFAPPADWPNLILPA